MATRTEATDNRPKQDRGVLGRSAATGRYVLKPASKPGTISLRDARMAIASLKKNDKKK